MARLGVLTPSAHYEELESLDFGEGMVARLLSNGLAQVGSDASRTLYKSICESSGLVRLPRTHHGSYPNPVVSRMASRRWPRMHHVFYPKPVTSRMGSL